MAKAKKGSSSKGTFPKKVTNKFQGVPGANTKQRKERLHAIVERHLNGPLEVMFSALDRAKKSDKKKY